VIAGEQNEVTRAVRTLIAGEIALGDLYKLYATRISAEQRFFTHLALEENYHARWLEGLFPKIDAGLVTFRDNRLQTGIFVEFLAYLRQRIAEARTQSPTLFAALSVARDLEGTVVEKCFFELFTSSDPAAHRTLRTLHTATVIHARRVGEKWEQHKPDGYHPFWS